MRAFFARHEQFERALSGESLRLLRKYRAASEHALKGLPAGSPARSGRPFWYYIPRWLHAKYRRNGSLTPAFIADVTWAQYCLFFAVRMQDDVLDRQAGDPGLVFLATQYFVEAERRLAIHLPRKLAFWEFYHEMLERTAAGILRTHALQGSATVPLARLRSAYAEVNSLFTIGSAAVCHRSGHVDDLPLIARLCELVCFSGQIADDLADIEEDLGAGKLNYVARLLLPPALRDAPARPGLQADIHRGLLLSDRLPRFLSALKQELTALHQEIRGLRLLPAERYIMRYIRMLGQLEDSLHQLKVSFVFGLPRPVR